MGKWPGHPRRRPRRTLQWDARQAPAGGCHASAGPQAAGPPGGRVAGRIAEHYRRAVAREEGRRASRKPGWHAPSLEPVSTARDGIAWMEAHGREDHENSRYLGARWTRVPEPRGGHRDQGRTGRRPRDARPHTPSPATTTTERKPLPAHCSPRSGRPLSPTTSKTAFLTLIGPQADQGFLTWPSTSGPGVTRLAPRVRSASFVTVRRRRRGALGHGADSGARRLYVFSAAGPCT